MCRYGQHTWDSSACDLQRPPQERGGAGCEGLRCAGRSYGPKVDGGPAPQRHPAMTYRCATVRSCVPCYAPPTVLTHGPTRRLRSTTGMAPASPTKASGGSQPMLAAPLNATVPAPRAHHTPPLWRRRRRRERPRATPANKTRCSSVGGLGWGADPATSGGRQPVASQGGARRGGGARGRRLRNTVHAHFRLGGGLRGPTRRLPVSPS